MKYLSPIYQLSLKHRSGIKRAFKDRNKISNKELVFVLNQYIANRFKITNTRKLSAVINAHNKLQNDKIKRNNGWYYK